jgi:hypothetical protein
LWPTPAGVVRKLINRFTNSILKLVGGAWEQLDEFIFRVKGCCCLRCRGSRGNPMQTTTAPAECDRKAA